MNKVDVKQIDQYNLWGIVPAAGKGTRMGYHSPKQYMHLHNQQTILDTTLKQLSFYPRLQALWVGVTNIGLPHSTLNLSNIHFYEGSVTRLETVLAGLNALLDRANGQDWVMIHDAVRPLITSSMIDKLYQEVIKHAHKHVGGLLALPVTDTVKQTQSGKLQAEQTLNRNQLWLAQTPQLFRFNDLWSALIELYYNGNIDQMTDEASVLEYFGYKPMLVYGSPYNIKITQKQDLPLANCYLSLLDY